MLAVVIPCITQCVRTRTQHDHRKVSIPLFLWVPGSLPRKLRQPSYIMRSGTHPPGGMSLVEHHHQVMASIAV